MIKKKYLTHEHQRLILGMYRHELPVLSSFFIQHYSNQQSKQKAISYLMAMSIILSAKDIFGQDKRKNYYQLTSYGVMLGEVLNKMDSKGEL